MLYLMFALGFIVATWLVSVFRCQIFGHTPSVGYTKLEGEGYLTLRRGPVDGIAREHARLYSECACCKQTFKVGNLHVQPTGQLYQRAANPKGKLDALGAN